MTKITTIQSEGRKFIIAHDEHGYWGIESKHIDSNGQLTTELNGVSGFLHDTMEATIDAVIFQTRFEALLGQGLSFQQAAMQMMA